MWRKSRRDKMVNSAMMKLAENDKLIQKAKKELMKLEDEQKFLKKLIKVAMEVQKTEESKLKEEGV
jgi:hypothetical protein